MVDSPPKASGKLARPDWLLCFAVTEEAASINFPLRHRVRTIITGMGRRNAEDAIEKALTRLRPRRVITAGFAGGLNPALRMGTVVFEADGELALAQPLVDAGAVPARFHCADRIAVTAAEKKKLHELTGADVIEMESQVIRSRCRNAGIPSATVRVVSDAADQDLPLDFNALMTPAFQINWWKFLRTLVARPLLIRRLIEFQRETREAAKELARILTAVLEQHRPKS